MAEPLLPYLQFPEIPIPIIGKLIDPQHPATIKPFGMLVALGVYLGAIVAGRRAKERKLDPAVMSQLIFWVVSAGFVGGHVLDAVFYHPARIAKDPLYVIRLWDGLSSYGGFIGAILGALAFDLLDKSGLIDELMKTSVARSIKGVVTTVGNSIHTAKSAVPSYQDAEKSVKGWFGQ